MFIARNKINPALILTASNDWKPARLCGPNGYQGRTFKTEAGAAKYGTPERVTA